MATAVQPPVAEKETLESIIEKMDLLQQKLQAESDARIKSDEDKQKLEERLARLQATKDRAQAKLDALQQRNLQARQGPAPRPERGGAPVEPEPDLREFANEKSREVMLLRKLMEYKLTEEDLPPDIEFETPAELDTALRLIRVEKQLAARDQQPQEEPVDDTRPIPKSSQAPVDTGGPTSLAPAPDTSSPDAMRERALALKAKGDPKSLEEARWLLLQANYRDPSKVMGRGRGGATVEG